MTYGIVIGILILALLATLIAVLVEKPVDPDPVEEQPEQINAQSVPASTLPVQTQPEPITWQEPVPDPAGTPVPNETDMIEPAEAVMLMATRELLLADPESDESQMYGALEPMVDDPSLWRFDPETGEPIVRPVKDVPPAIAPDISAETPPEQPQEPIPSAESDEPIDAALLSEPLDAVPPDSADPNPVPLYPDPSSVAEPLTAEGEEAPTADEAIATPPVVVALPVEDGGDSYLHRAAEPEEEDTAPIEPDVVPDDHDTAPFDPLPSEATNVEHADAAMIATAPVVVASSAEDDGASDMSDAAELEEVDTAPIEPDVVPDADDTAPFDPLPSEAINVDSQELIEFDETTPDDVPSVASDQFASVAPTFVTDQGLSDDPDNTSASSESDSTSLHGAQETPEPTASPDPAQGDFAEFPDDEERPPADLAAIDVAQELITDGVPSPEPDPAHEAAPTHEDEFESVDHDQAMEEPAPNEDGTIDSPEGSDSDPGPVRF